MVFNLRTFSFTSSVEDHPTPPKSFSLKELRVATHNFSRDNFLGYDWRYEVYRGRLADGSLVAIQRARRVYRWVEENFEAEMQVGSTVSTHPNVLCLWGFCRTKKELLLVHPLMINNTLSYNLRGRPDRFARPLDWNTRKRIALGAARGLAHLHNQGNIKIMHRNICPSNILLNEHFEAVIGGFSLALIMHERNVGENSASSGSEIWYRAKWTDKNDVWAYGRMLLELISGRRSSKLWVLADDENFNLDLTKTKNLNLEEWIGDSMNKNELGRVIDPNLQGNYVEEEAERLLPLALLCARMDPSVRPEMSEVVRLLESQFLRGDPSSRSSWSQSECDSTPYYSFPPSPSPLGIAP